MLTPENRILVSKMAELHRLSRQALILYDKSGLFRPALVDENGYRYYTYTQVPQLREICYLKAIGVKLEDIKEHIDNNRTPDSAHALLAEQDRKLAENVREIERKRRSIHDRIAQLEEAQQHEKDVHRPYVATLPRRTILFEPWETNDLTRKDLHLTLMNAWTRREEYAGIPPSSWGALIRKDALGSDTPFAGAGAYVLFECDDVDVRDVQGGAVLEEGLYACMYKCGMPYEIEHVRYLLDWIAENGYEAVGDVVDTCLLDTTYYTNDMVGDFCLLQIPVRRV
ncbi:MAG: MerR family transcriptional regulator [Oscillospiraceae bacterium]|nr:MerR family transcriptional regulator [Oscillospiraceae bacterium]